MDNRSKKQTIYTIGAMEKAENMGAGWRNRLTPFLEELGFEVLNPTEFEPEQLKGLQPNRLPESYTDLFGNKCKPTHWHHLKFASEPHLRKRFKKYMQHIVRYDMNIVKNVADIMVAYWDEFAGKGAGSHSEITHAFLYGKPIYMIATTEIPAWLTGIVTEIFLSEEDFKKFMSEEYGE